MIIYVIFLHRVVVNLVKKFSNENCDFRAGRQLAVRLDIQLPILIFRGLYKKGISCVNLCNI